MNTIKTGFLLIVMSMLLIMAGYFLGGPVWMAVALGLALVMNAGAYWYSDKLALKMAGAREVTPEEAPELHFIVDEQARQSNLPKPRVYIIQNDSPNAFATGRNPRNAAVAATTGIMRILNRDELSAVMAHEMAHVGNRDTLIMTVAATIAGAITFLAMIARFSMFFGGFGGGFRPKGLRRPRTHDCDSRPAGSGYTPSTGRHPGAGGYLTGQGVPGRLDGRQDVQEPLGLGQRAGEAGA